MATIKEIEEFIEQEIPIAKSDAEKYQKHLDNEIKRIQKKKDTYKQITFKVRKSDENLKIIEQFNEEAMETNSPKGEFFISKLSENYQSINKVNEEKKQLIHKIWLNLSDEIKTDYNSKYENFNVKTLINFLNENYSKPNRGFFR